MKQIIQNYETVELKLREVPVRLFVGKRILVRNRASLVSIGRSFQRLNWGVNL